MGAPTFVPQALKNVGLPKIPGDIGIAFCGNTNLVPSILMLLLWEICCACGCSAVGGVALPLLMVSLFCVTELLLVFSLMCVAAADMAVGVMTVG